MIKTKHYIYALSSTLFLINNILLTKIVNASVFKPVIVEETTELRCEPSLKSVAFGTARNGTTLSACTQCEENERIDADGNRWVRIFWESKEVSIYGWVLGEHLNENVPY